MKPSKVACTLIMLGQSISIIAMDRTDTRAQLWSIPNQDMSRSIVHMLSTPNLHYCLLRIRKVRKVVVSPYPYFSQWPRTPI